MDSELRAAALRWVSEQHLLHGGVIPRAVLEAGFVHDDQRITLVSRPGIWRPRGFDMPLSITTTPQGPYRDDFTDDGLLRYRYRGTDPAHRDNVGLREAMRTKTPLVYFHGILPGRYVAVWPVLIMEDSPQDLSFLVAVDPVYVLGNSAEAEHIADGASDSALGVRRYVVAATRRRLHQVAFREQVVAAYESTCTLCRLRRAPLLDAAHIIPDSRPRGEPIVPNRLCLCKIHHAAYDQDLIGISPDYVIHVRQEVLEETDGPMLQHGLKGLHHGHIVLPRRKSDRPDPVRLEERFVEFARAV